MRPLLILALAAAVFLIWFRSRARGMRPARGSLLELIAFVVMLAGFFGLIMLAARLF